ncbi:hypothetical protein [Actinocorallia libanotica]|uniref:2-polyprenyl-6-methoxyphenol hydroxylase-like FAD-dependent oxidoreductase n=1 Tax=Actinocorallia libanotica TaxID=46162 RepID=A0ABN1RV12_9ACTN
MGGTTLTRRRHAVVVGGSLAGLLSARVLLDHFEEVTLLERDGFPGEPVSRPGVPQGRHLHVLWEHGRGLLDGLIPGLESDLLAGGAPDLRLPADFLWLTSGGWRRRFDTTRMLTFSRGLLDHAVRGRLFGEPRLAVRTGIEVTGLTGDEAVTGVRYTERGDAARAEELMAADLVVDATGRGSHAPAWLAELGRPLPRETRIDPLLGYASRYYAIPPGHDPGWKALYLQAGPPEAKRTGGLFPQEGGRWICSLSGAGGDYPPTDEEGYLEYARGLRDPVLYEAIKDAEPLTPVVSFRRTAGHRRHYDRMRSWPAGFAAIGDSVCAFNPIYGQGITVAAASALELDRMLREDRSTRWFQRRAKRAGAGAWLISTGEDRRYAETQGPRVLPHTRLINAYVSLAVRAANTDPDSCADMLDVLGLAKPPTSLFRPAALARIMANRSRPPEAAPLLPEPAAR